MPSEAGALPISVIIPTRNTRDLTLRCLAALAASSHIPAEILLVDDGSDDGTSEAVRVAYPHTRIIEPPQPQLQLEPQSQWQPRGFTASINAAWPLATSAIVLLLNSDTEVQPQALAGIARAFASDPRLGIAGATLWHPDGRRQWSAGREPTPWWLFVMASGLSSALGRLPGWRRLRPESQAHGDAAWVPATAMAVRREVRAAIGEFDPDLALYAQDLDYCVRARTAGWRVAQLADVDVMHIGGATVSAAPLTLPVVVPTGPRHDDRRRRASAEPRSARPTSARAGAAEASACADSGDATAGTSSATGLRQDPVALFGDLARWLRKSQEPRAARAGCRALWAGCRGRIVARQLLRWFRGGSTRAAWDRDTARYRAALDAIALERERTL